MQTTTAAAATSSTPFDARRQVFVVGNEAADADSLVSAFAMAALLDTEEVQGIALAQITREEFRLRGDCVLLFEQANSERASDGCPSRLLFWDDVDWGVVDRLQSRSHSSPALVLLSHSSPTLLPL